VSKEEESLRSYILGRLPEREQIKIEGRLLLDSDYVELLQIVEEELIDGYARGRLPEDERKELDESLARNPVLRRKLTMARPFITHADQWRPPERKRPSESLWQRWLGFWGLLVMRTFTPAWRLAVWAALVLAGGVAAWQVFLYQSLADKARIALQASFRESPIEGRIDGLNWLPHPTTLGGQSGAADEISLERAKLFSHDAVATKGNSDSHHALGQFYLAHKEWDKAISELETAVEGDRKNAGLQSDLGTAYLERARAAQEKAGPDKSPEEKDTSLQDFDQCLNHLNQALKLDGSLPPALFNIALCHEYMSLLPQAELDWQKYLKRDSTSAWAAEARRHIEQIGEKKQKDSQSNADLLKEFREAYARNDRQTAWKLVSENRELVKGRVIWWQLLNDYFDLAGTGNTAEAKERLNELRYAGNLELSLGNEDGGQTGDRYISELAAFYLSLPSRQAAALSEAHRRVNEGVGFHSAGKYDTALNSYGLARGYFERAGDFWELKLTDYLVANVRFLKADNAQSLAVFSGLVTDCEKERHLCLLAQSLCSLGMVQDSRAEHSKALESTNKALQISAKIGDLYDTQRSLAQIADQYKKLGNYDRATRYISLCLWQISAGWPGERQMWRNFDQFTQVLVADRLYDAATAYASGALRLALAEQDSQFKYVSYADLALLRSKQQDYPEAIELAQLGFEAAPDSPDTHAYASLQLGNVHRQAGDLTQALKDYDQCIRYILSVQNISGSGMTSELAETKTDRPSAWLYAAHKGRLFCLLTEGTDGAVEREIQTTLNLLESYRESIREEQNRNAFFDVEQTVYDAAIDFEYSRRGNRQAAFDQSEESRARSLLELIGNVRNQDPAIGQSEILRAQNVIEVRQGLPDQAQLIEYAVLENRVLICLVSKSEFSVEQAPIRLDELTDKVSRFRRSIMAGPGLPTKAEELSGLRSQAQELYRLLIEPIRLSPENGKRVCFVPDKVLNTLPFSALVSPTTGRYLIEDYELTVAPSATVYLVCSRTPGHTPDLDSEHLLAVGNPEFDRSVFPGLSSLQQTEGQVGEIAKLYASASPSVLTRNEARKTRVMNEMPSSDVIHLASHYIVYPGEPMNSTLLLSRPPDGGDSDGPSANLQANEVYGLKLRRAPVVVLSACDSGVEDYYNGEGMIGMSRVFIAAGAPVVVASLWQVETAATGKLMVSFHQHRKVDRTPTAEALALAQRDMLIGASGEDHRHPYYWAGFTAIGGATTF
jgi:CHAT domain-containing protein